MPQSTRRDFLKTTTLSGVGLWVASQATAQAQSPSPNEKLNIAIIGAGGRGAGNLEGVKNENIVALCDVDEQRAAQAFQEFPHAARYHDFRKMLETEKSVEAVVVSTPDHCHAAAAIMAMRLGKHVYCEKPLTYSIYEARLMREVAAQYKVASQMGNQGHSNDGSRRSVELVRAGVLGKVQEVHCWTDRPIWPQQIDRPTDVPAVPYTMKWDLWLGPAPKRPYHPAYAPFNWRGWWDFGTGALGDMACHVIDMAYWALKLTSPLTIEAEVSELHPETAPQWSIIRYVFPARDELPPVKLTWYDGGKKPDATLVGGRELPTNGTILVGDRATMFVPDAYGAEFKILEHGQEIAVEGPVASIPRSPGHHQEWIQACKGGPASLSNFEYSGPLTEMVLLGNVAIRMGREIVWDAENLKIVGCREADDFLHREYRKGWEL